MAMEIFLSSAYSRLVNETQTVEGKRFTKFAHVMVVAYLFPFPYQLSFYYVCRFSTARSSGYIRYKKVEILSDSGLHSCQLVEVLIFRKIG